MNSSLSIGVIIGISIGVAIGVVIAGCLLLCYQAQRKKKQVTGGSEQRGMQLPIRVNGFDASSMLSDTTTDHDSPPRSKENKHFPSWFGVSEKSSVLSHSGLPVYPYKDLQKATANFTTKLGEGAFGPVYKAMMSEGGTFAVKVLSSQSKQGEKEFLNEVLLLGRLHHRNLVNLVGYCAEKGHRILVYEFMSNGSLAELLYGEGREPLSWDLRVQIAQDVARGIEYLHEGATPPVIHRDIKSANILLDASMKARVADFGLSKEMRTEYPNSGVRGTFGYVDPEYISTSQFTLKSDVYSFGILLFELITARNPQKGLMDYVGLALLNAEGEEGWEEILDDRISGMINTAELRALACLAKQCVSPSSRNRPRMREVTQQLVRLGIRRNSSRIDRNRVVADNTLQAAMRAAELSRADLRRLASIPERIEV
ncbi:hypothetical protein GOP47_0030446 [Adiantum capillus-veneris]|nr:hypothetical protein GOP47_0030102 [Adiantum capillus-veneris]KAI5055301.1 hypothetical protein GOP47_0030446 [Adiantum capillus-veneris]